MYRVLDSGKNVILVAENVKDIIPTIEVINGHVDEETDEVLEYNLEELVYVDDLGNEYPLTTIFVNEVKEKIEKIATKIVRDELDELDYDSEGEVALYAANEESKWHDEAVALQKWIESVYDKMYELQDNVTAENYAEFTDSEITSSFPTFQ